MQNYLTDLFARGGDEKGLQLVIYMASVLKLH